ncbi:MAG: hypothetical protein R2867_16050 [Caldilineaceae bacterium]
MRKSGLMKHCRRGCRSPLWRSAQKQCPCAAGDNGGRRCGALFQYTGTTGLPKAAMLTNRNLVSNVHQVIAWFAKVRPGEEKVLAAILSFTSMA